MGANDPYNLDWASLNNLIDKKKIYIFMFM